MQKTEIILVHEKDTKGTHVFSTDDPSSPVSTLYVSKTAGKTFSDGKVPKQIKITIEEVP